jgi:hypothetical protein
MKIIALALIIVSMVQRGEATGSIAKVALKSGKTLIEVTVVEGSGEGLRLKHRGGTQMFPISDLSPEGAKQLGAFDPGTIDPKTATAEEQGTARTLKGTIEKKAEESKADYRKRLASHAAGLRNSARIWWDKARTAQETGKDIVKEGGDPAAVNAVAAKAFSFALAYEMAALEVSVAAQAK